MVVSDHGHGFCNFEHVRNGFHESSPKDSGRAQMCLEGSRPPQFLTTGLLELCQKELLKDRNTETHIILHVYCMHVICVIPYVCVHIYIYMCMHVCISIYIRS